jgi:hypothetical protein
MAEIKQFPETDQIKFRRALEEVCIETFTKWGCAVTKLAGGAYEIKFRGIKEPVPVSSLDELNFWADRLANGDLS